MGCITSTPKNPQENTNGKSINSNINANQLEKSVNSNIKPLPKLDLAYDSQEESSEDHSGRMQTEKLELGKYGHILTFMTLLEERMVVEWVCYSKTKQNIELEVSWTIVNCQFSGKNIGSAAQPIVKLVVEPLKKVTIGVVEVLLNDSFDFKISASWKTSEADEEYLENLEKEQNNEVDQKIRKKTEFIDKDFPPNSTILFRPNTQAILDDKKEPVKLDKINSVMIEDKKIFEFDGSVCPYQIESPKNFVLFNTILAILAEKPYLIERLFITKVINEEGKYIMRLYINGEWKGFYLDQYLPFKLGNNQLAFSRAKNNLLWVSFLEKLYAKHLGNYGDLENINPFHCLNAYTGHPTQKISLTNTTGKKIALDLLRLLNENDKLLLFAAFKYKNYMTLKLGLTTNRLLPIIRYVEGETDLVVLRNFCHPEYKWRGKWCEGSECWTPELLEKCMPYSDPGEVWMDKMDFFKIFNLFGACHLDYEKTQKFNLKFIESEEDDNIITDFLKISIPPDTKIAFASIIRLWDESKIFRQNGQKMDIGAIFVRIESGEICAVIEPNFESYISNRVDLGEGEYIMIVYTNTPFINIQNDADLTLSIIFSLKKGKVECSPEDFEGQLSWLSFKKCIQNETQNKNSTVEKIDKDERFCLFKLKYGVLEIAALQTKSALNGKVVEFEIDCSENFNLIPASDTFIGLEKRKFSAELNEEEFTVVAKFVNLSEEKKQFFCNARITEVNDI